MGHLGSRVSALLDGQLPPLEAERAWAHVHLCHTCRDQVEREGWVKTRLAGLSLGSGAAPEHLKGSLIGSPGLPANPALPVYAERPRRQLGLAVLGGGAVGAAVVGVLALGVGPADAPVDRRQPVTNIRQGETPAPVPAPRPSTRP